MPLSVALEAGLEELPVASERRPLEASPVSREVRRAHALFGLADSRPTSTTTALTPFPARLLGTLRSNVAGRSAAALAMAINASAFLGEIWRGCIQSVHKSQWEAAECLGLTRWQRMVKIVLPQALRIATPPTVGFLVQIIKNTSVASLVIGFAELSYNAKVLNNSTFQPFIYFGAAALLYFAMCYPLSRWSRALERKLNAGRH
jgi:polar amino acid transport system permease protein